MVEIVTLLYYDGELNNECVCVCVCVCVREREREREREIEREKIRSSYENWSAQ